MLNPNYRKSVFKDENGNTLLPQTTASMVSEEPDRRFVDNVEKSLLSSLADNREALESLSENVSNLVVLSENLDVILPGTEVRDSLQAIFDNIDSLARITANIEEIINLANGSLQLPSSSGKEYNITIDDSSGTPTIVLTEILPE